MFYVGQKVVCVDDKAEGSGWPAQGAVIKDCVYTVRQVGIDCRGGPGLRLQETVLTGGPDELGYRTRAPIVDNFYRASRFRPILTRKTSIETFTRMLTPTSPKKLEPV